MARKSLLIFDLDGTLADTTPIHALAFREVFAPLRIVPNYSTIAGMTTEAAVDVILADAGKDLAPDDRANLVRAKRSRSLALIETDLVAIDGSVNFVMQARRFYRLALCSSGSKPSVDRTIRLLGLSGMFELLITADDVVNGKPHPESYLKVLASTRVGAEDSLVFEDAPSGIEAAARAGIETVRIDDRGDDGIGWAVLLDALGEISG